MSETVECLGKERIANLLKIWSSGRRRLTPSELAELEPVLPRPALIRPPIVEREYEQTLAHYTKIYGVAERTLKEWKSLGRAAQPEPDMPPLDDPPRMKDWYARRKKNRVPARLLRIAADAARQEAASAAPREDPLPAPAPAPSPGHAPSVGHVSNPTLPPNDPPDDPSPESARGYSATLDRLRRAEAAAGDKYTRLILEDGKESEADLARRAWQLLTKELRSYEKDAEEILQKSGQSWVAADVVVAMHEIHVPMRDSILALYDRLEAKLETLNRTERRRLYREEVGRVFAALVANRFTSASLGDDR